MMEESMLDTLTFAELDAQQPELLPPRTVLSLISSSIWKSGDCNGGGPYSSHDCGGSSGGDGGATTTSCKNFLGLNVADCNTISLDLL
jgi:hypothetical protein